MENGNDVLGQRLEEQERRLARLEADNARARKGLRRWRGLAASGAMACAAVVLMGQGKAPNEVEGSNLSLQDGQGRTRAELKMQDGEPHLTFYNAAGDARMDLYTSNDGGSSLGFLDNDGDVRVALTADADGTTTLGFLDDQGRQQVGLSAEADGDGGLVFSSGGTIRTQISSGNVPSFGLRDGENELRLLMAVSRDGDPLIIFRDAEGNNSKIIQGN